MSPYEIDGRRATLRYAVGPERGDGEVAAWVEITEDGLIVARQSNPGVGAQPWDPPLAVVLQLVAAIAGGGGAADLEQGIREALAAYKADDGNAAQAGLNLAATIAELLPEGTALVFGDEEDKER